MKYKSKEMITDTDDEEDFLGFDDDAIEDATNKLEVVKRIAETDASPRQVKKLKLGSPDETEPMPVLVSKVGASEINDLGTAQKDITSTDEVVENGVSDDLVKATKRKNSVLSNGTEVNGFVNSEQSPTEPVPFKIRCKPMTELNSNSQSEMDSSESDSNKGKIPKTKDVFDIFMGGKKEITVNRDVLEDIVMIKLTEYLVDKGQTGALRVTAQKLEEETERLRRQVTNFKKQYEDARRVIKRLIDEKMSGKTWTNHVLPPKVTRSVGLQVCLCGSMQVKGGKSLSSQNQENRNPVTPVKPVEPRTVPEKPAAVLAPTAQPQSQAPRVNTVKSPQSPQVTMHPVRTNQTSNQVAQKQSAPQQPAPQQQQNPPAQRPIPRQNAKKSTTSLPGRHSLNNGTKQLRPVPKPIAASPVQNNTVQVTPVRPTAPAQPKPALNEIIDLTDKDDVQESATTDKPTESPQQSQNSFQLKISSTATRPEIGRETVTLPDSTINLQENGVTLKTVDLVKKLMTPNSPTAETEITATQLPYPPLPKAPSYSPKIPRPPRPLLRICRSQQPGRTGIMLSWNFSNEERPPAISKYQVFAYQEGVEEGKDTWKKVGDVDALPLPMACTLTQFKDGFKYHFAVRAIDSNSRVGDFSLPGSIKLQPQKRTSQNGR